MVFGGACCCCCAASLSLPSVGVADDGVVSAVVDDDDIGRELEEDTGFSLSLLESPLNNDIIVKIKILYNKEKVIKRKKKIITREVPQAKLTVTERWI